MESSGKLKVAIIPARGGSQRIHKKNIKDFNGKPIISYSIDAARDSNIFDKILVSTDCTQIQKVAIDYGAEVLRLRSEKNSDSYSTLSDVMIEEIHNLSIDLKNLDYICCILATAPFLTGSLLKESEVEFKKKSYDSFFPVVEYQYPIQRSLKLNQTENNFIMAYPEHLNTRSQDLQKHFHDAGMFYFLNPKKLISNQAVFSQNNGCVTLSPWYTQDIDTEEDWNYAEIKYQNLKSANMLIK